VKRLGWAELFEGYGFARIYDLVVPPTPCPAGTPITVEAILWLVIIEVCLRISQNCRDTSHALANEMARNGPEPVLSPFACPHLESSIRAYALTWGKVLLFFLRTRPGEDHDCPAYFLTESQVSALAHLKSLLLLASRDANWRDAVLLSDLPRGRRRNWIPSPEKTKRF
jgi:hypothetical protein